MGATKATGIGKTNTTTERLHGLPFDTATELKDAQKEILKTVWTQLESAKVLNELVSRPEYSFWKNEFGTGLLCVYGDDSEQLVRVYADTPVGIKIAITSQSSSNESLIGVLVKSMSESFAVIYYKAKGILPQDTARIDNNESQTKPSREP